MEHTIALIFVLIMGAGILSHWLAWRFHLPAIVLLSIAGLLLGPVFGVIHPHEDLGASMEPIIQLSVAIILFEGGLKLHPHELKGTAKVVTRLVTAGVVLSWILGSAAAFYIGGLSLPVATVLGAILVVTGPTVIIPMLRQAVLNPRTSAYLKWEGIINDPIGVLLAVLVFEYWLHAGRGAALMEVLESLAIAVGAAIALGMGGAYLIGRVFRAGLLPEYLKAPSLIGSVLVVFIASNLAVGESGLLAVTIFGIAIARMDLPSIDEIRRFKENISVLLLSLVFILLTASFEPSLFTMFDLRSVALIAAFMFLVRPIAVTVATLGSGIGWRDQVLVGLIGPRGVVAAATAGIFAPRLAEAGYSDANMLTPLVFAVIFATVPAHGFSIGWLSRKLGLAGEQAGVLIVGASPWSTDLAILLRELDVSVLLTDTSRDGLRRAKQNGVDIFHGEILSEQAHEDLELNEMEVLLAATRDDGYNALLCTTFAPEFGQNHAYQLPLHDGESDHRRSLTRRRRGILIMGEEAWYERLWQYENQGWEFRTIPFKGKSTAAEVLPPETLTVLKVAKNGHVRFFAPEQSFELAKGDTVVVFCPPDVDDDELRTLEEIALQRADGDVPEEGEERPRYVEETADEAADDEDRSDNQDDDRDEETGDSEEGSVDEAGDDDSEGNSEQTERDEPDQTDDPNDDESSDDEPSDEQPKDRGD